MNNAPVGQEIDVTHLPITGQIPVELAGRYLRNGPNPRQPDDHWFSGDGMVHGIQLSAGGAQWYRNRFVRTDSFDRPIPLYGSDGSRNLHSSVANTHVVGHAGRVLALVETSLPYEITTDLQTVGCFDFDGRLQDSMTAHPKICPRTGELHFFGYGNLREPYVTYHRADADGTLTVEQPIDVPGLTMMHDFCLTEDYVVFLDLPVVFRMDLAHQGGGMPYRWSDEYGARMGVMHRADPTAPLRWFEIEPCYLFHTASAHNTGDRIVIVGARYPSLWRGTDEFDTASVLWEWTLDLSTGTSSERQLDDTDCEFPRIDDRRTGAAAQVAYCAATDALIRYDLQTGDSIRHEFASGRPGEAIFVPSAARASETEGFLLAYVFRRETATSDLIILDANDVAAAPLAAIHLPHRVPNGFHGNWFPTTTGA